MACVHQDKGFPFEASPPLDDMTGTAEAIRHLSLRDSTLEARQSAGTLEKREATSDPPCARVLLGSSPSTHACPLYACQTHVNSACEPRALGEALVAALASDARPHFAPLYDCVYAAMRKAGSHRQSYAQHVHQGACDALAQVLARPVSGGASDDKTRNSFARPSAMVHPAIEPDAVRYRLMRMGPEAFSASLVGRIVPYPCC